MDEDGAARKEKKDDRLVKHYEGPFRRGIPSLLQAEKQREFPG
jgi:hypothetical protein